ncbi:MAG TPA: carbohydrate porin [Deltaproteobacteria bacterium]|nr:carbohydrate porin [Deltaproteobacteria bacterium]
MRSKLIIVATAAASLVLTAQMAAADPVQEQLRLMEQRMAEMEDRLQATSDELRAAKATVDEQQGLLSEAGLVDGSDEGIRSSVGNFMKEIDISGVAAASYNYRFKGPGDANNDNVGLYRHMNASTFAFDQLWITMDKEPTEEARAGFHADLVYGESARAHGGDRSVFDSNGISTGDSIRGDEFLLYSAYASYLANVGSGMRIDAGRLATPLGAEVLQTNQNFNITQGLVWGVQPVTHTGIQVSGNITDEIGLAFGVVNDVYDDTFVDDSRDKAYYGQISFSTDMYGISVGAIVGKDSASEYRNEGGGTCRSGDECKTSVFNVVATADPSDAVSMWLDFTWVKAFGDDMNHKGDIHAAAIAGRWGITDSTGIAGRVEYVRTDNNFMRALGESANTGEVMSYTVTADHALTDSMKVRLEARYDRNFSNGALFAIGSNNDGASSNSTTGKRNDQLVGLAEIYYEF